MCINIAGLDREPAEFTILTIVSIIFWWIEVLLAKTK